MATDIVKDRRKFSQHNVSILNRERINLTGVEKVISVEPEVAFFITSYGKLKLTGSDLAMTNLSIETGDVELAGKLNGMNYMTKEKTSEGLIKRLFE